MLSSFYVLRALAEEWSEVLKDGIVESAYSQRADELSITVIKGDDETTIRAQFAGRLRYIFADASSGRARRNVATVLEACHGCQVTGLRVADRDRILHVDFVGGKRIDIVLFGSRANAFLVGERGEVVDTFRTAREPKSPVPRPAPSLDALRESVVLRVSEICDGASSESGRARLTTARFVAGVFPLLNTMLATECVSRGGLPEFADQLHEDAPLYIERIVAAISSVHLECMAAAPRIYWAGRRPGVLSVVELRHVTGTGEMHEELFDTVSEAVRVFVKRSLAWQRFDDEFLPVRRAVKRDVAREQERLKKLREQLQAPSRADDYEKWGHTLMALPQTPIPSGAPGSRVTIRVADPYGEAEFVEIPVVSDLSAVENAQRYYEKARSTRLAGRMAQARLTKVEKEFDDIRRVEAVIATVTDPESWKEVRKTSRSLLERNASSTGASERAIPYRRFDIGSGFDVWVGRNAKQNDELTTRAARKFDIWLHARGVGGSHVLLRPPNRTAGVPEGLVLRAAAIAAYYSKARGSSLVPVVVAERKYVRKPRRAPPGTVLVDRHRVVMVEPGLPEQD